MNNRNPNSALYLRNYFVIILVQIAIKSAPAFSRFLAIDEEVKNIHEDITGVRTPSFDGIPRAHYPQDGEERYRQAVENMDWFKLAWEALSEDERYILTEFYITSEEQKIAAKYNICDHFGIERSSAYNKKNRALMSNIANNFTHSQYILVV